ncbi:ribonuclease H-like domain-containing protein [Pyronema omphalodes]|nr:ribonuclease H-like domain-containing protein [Pyronema omphalodes]
MQNPRPAHREKSARAPASQKSFKCDVCDRDFASEKALQDHNRNSTVHEKIFRMQTNAAKQITSNLVTNITAMGAVSASTVFTSGLASQPAKTLGMITSSLSSVVKNVSQPDSSTGPTIYTKDHEVWDSFEMGNHRWTMVDIKNATRILNALAQACHSQEQLKKDNYTLEPPSAKFLDGLKICKNCAIKKKDVDSPRGQQCIWHSQNPRRIRGMPLQPYPCCGKKSRGCETAESHVFKAPPDFITSKYRNFAGTPQKTGAKKCLAVVLDCEMAGVKGGQGELIQLVAVDFVTGKTLINTLVAPTQPIIDWRSWISGVTKQDMDYAIRMGKALNGWQEARKELWKHIDSETILVGHALNHDLDALRMIHTNIVDSMILSKNVSENGQQCSLMRMSKELLGMVIQNHGKSGHDCVEDTLATREVVLWCMRNPEGLKEWGKTQVRRQVPKSNEGKNASDKTTGSPDDCDTEEGGVDLPIEARKNDCQKDGIVLDE